MNEQSSGINKSPSEATSVVQHLESESFPYRLPVWKLSAQPIRFSNNELINANTIRIRSCDFNTNYYNISFNNNCIRWLRRIKLDVNEIVTEQFPNNINVVNPYFPNPPKDEWHLCTLYVTPSQYDNVDAILNEMNYRFNESIKSLFNMTSKTLPSKDGISYTPLDEINSVSAFSLKEVSVYDASMNTYNNYPAAYIVEGDIIYTKPSTNDTRYISNCIIDLQRIDGVTISESSLINPKFEGNKIKIFENSGYQYVYNVSILNAQHQGNIAILNDSNIIKASTLADVRYSPLKNISRYMVHRNVADIVSDSSLTTRSIFDTDRIISSFDDEYTTDSVSFYNDNDAYATITNSSDPTDITTYATILPERLRGLNSRSVDVPATRAANQSSILDYEPQVNPLKFTDTENILINKVHIKSFPDYIGLSTDPNRYIFNNSRYHYIPLYNPDIEMTFDFKFTAHNEDDNIYLTADDGTISIKSTAFATEEIDEAEIKKERKTASLINYYGWITNDQSIPKLRVLVNDNSRNASQYPFYQIYTSTTTHVPTRHNVYYHNAENPKTHTFTNAVDFIKTSSNNRNIDIWFDLRNANIDLSRVNADYSEWLYSYTVKSGLLNEFIIDALSCSPKIVGYKLHAVEHHSEVADFDLTRDNTFESRISPSPAIKIAEEFTNVSKKMNIDNIVTDLKSSIIIVPISSLTRTDTHGFNELAYSKKITTDPSIAARYQYHPDGIYYSDGDVAMNCVSFMATDVMRVEVTNIHTHETLNINSLTVFTRVPDDDGLISDTNPVYSELFISTTGDIIVRKPKYVIIYKNNKLNASTIRINTEDGFPIINSITVPIASCTACDINGNIERLWYRTGSVINKLANATTEVPDINKCYTNGADTKNYVIVSLFNDNKYDSILDTSNNLDNESSTSSLASLKIYRNRDEDLYKSIMLPVNSNSFNYSDIYTSKIKDLLYLPFGVCNHIGVLTSNISETPIDDTYMFNDVVDTDIEFKFDKFRFRNLNKLVSTSTSTTTTYKIATGFNEGHTYYVRNIDNEFEEIKNANMLFTGVTEITDKNRNILFGSNLIRYYVSNIVYNEVHGAANIAALEQKYYKYNNIYSYVADNNKYMLDDRYVPKNGGSNVCITKTANLDASDDMPYDNSSNIFTTTEIKYDIDGNATFVPNATEITFDSEVDADLIPNINNLFTESPTETEKQYVELSKAIIYTSNRNYESTHEHTSDLYLFKGSTADDYKNQQMYTPINTYQMNTVNSTCVSLASDMLTNNGNLNLISKAITSIQKLDKSKYEGTFPLSVNVVNDNLYASDHTQIQLYTGNTKVDILSSNISHFTITELTTTNTFVCNDTIAKVFLHDEPKTELEWVDILRLAEIDNAGAIKINYDPLKKCSYINSTYVDIKIISAINDYDPVGSHFYNNNVGSLDTSLGMFYKYITYFESADGTLVSKVDALYQASPYEYAGYTQASKQYAFKISDLQRFTKEYTFSSSNKLASEPELTTDANDMCSWKPVELAPHTWGFMKFDRDSKYICNISTNTNDIAIENAWICGSADEYSLLRAFNNVSVSASNAFVAVDYVIAVKDKGVDFKLLDGMLFKLSNPGSLLETLKEGEFVVLHYGARKHLIVPNGVTIPTLANDDYVYIDTDNSLKVTKLQKKIIPPPIEYMGQSFTKAYINNLTGNTNVRVHDKTRNFEFAGEFVSGNFECLVKTNIDRKVEVSGGNGVIQVKETSTGDIYKITSKNILIEGVMRSDITTGEITIDGTQYTSVAMVLSESSLYLSEDAECDLSVDFNINLNLNASDYTISKTTMNVSDVTLSVSNCKFTTADADTDATQSKTVKDYINIKTGNVNNTKPVLATSADHQFNYTRTDGSSSTTIHKKPTMPNNVTHRFEYIPIAADGKRGAATTIKPTIPAGTTHKFTYSFTDATGMSQTLTNKPKAPVDVTHQFAYVPVIDGKDGTAMNTKPVMSEGITHQFKYIPVWADGKEGTATTTKPTVSAGVTHQFTYTATKDGTVTSTNVKPVVSEGTNHQFSYVPIVDGKDGTATTDKPSIPNGVVHKFNYIPIVDGKDGTPAAKPSIPNGVAHKFNYIPVVDGKDGTPAASKPSIPNGVVHKFNYIPVGADGKDGAPAAAKPSIPNGVAHKFNYIPVGADGTDGTPAASKPSIPADVTHKFTYTNISTKSDTNDKPTGGAIFTYTSYVNNTPGNSTTTKPAVSEAVKQLKFIELDASNKITSFVFDPPIADYDSKTEADKKTVDDSVANSTYIVSSGIVKFVNYAADGKTEANVVYEPALTITTDSMNTVESSVFNARVGSNTYTVTSALSNNTSKPIRFEHGNTKLYIPNIKSGLNEIEQIALDSNLDIYKVTSGLSDGTSTMIKFVSGDAVLYSPAQPDTNSMDAVETAAYNAMAINTYKVTSGLSDGTSTMIKFTCGDKVLYSPTQPDTNSMDAVETAAYNAMTINTYKVTSSLSDGTSTMIKFVSGDAVLYSPAPPASDSMDAVETAAYSAMAINTYKVTSSLSDGTSTMIKFVSGDAVLYSPSQPDTNSMDAVETAAYNARALNTYKVTSSLSDGTSTMIKFTCGSTVVFEPSQPDTNSMDAVETAAYNARALNTYRVESSFTGGITKINKYVCDDIIVYEPSLVKSVEYMNAAERAAVDGSNVVIYTVTSSLSDGKSYLHKFIHGDTFKYVPALAKPITSLNTVELAAINRSKLATYKVTSTLSDGTSTMNIYQSDAVTAYEPPLAKTIESMDEVERAAYNAMTKNTYKVTSSLSNTISVMNKYVFNTATAYEPALSVAYEKLNTAELYALSRIKSVTYTVASILKNGNSSASDLKFNEYVSYKPGGTTIDKTIYDPSPEKSVDTMNAAERAAFNAMAKNTYTIISTLSNNGMSLHKYVCGDTIVYEPAIMGGADNMNDIERAAVDGSNLVTYTVSSNLTDGSKDIYKFINYATDNTNIESTTYEPRPSVPIDNMNDVELAAFNTLNITTFNVTYRTVTESIKVKTEHVSSNGTLVVDVAVNTISSLPSLITGDNKVSLAGTVKSMRFTNTSGTNITIDYTKNISLVGNYTIANGVVTITNPTITNEFFPTAAETHSTTQTIIPTGKINGQSFASTVNGFDITDITIAHTTISSPKLKYSIDGTMSYTFNSITYSNLTFELSTETPSIANASGILTVSTSGVTVKYSENTITDSSITISQNLATAEFKTFAIRGIIVYPYKITQLPKIYNYVDSAYSTLKQSLNQVIYSDNEADRAANVDDNTIIQSESIVITYAYDSQSISSCSKVIHCYHLWPSLVTDITDDIITYETALDTEETTSDKGFSVDLSFILYNNATHNLLSSFYKSSTTIGNTTDKYLTFINVSDKYQPISPSNIPPTIEHTNAHVYKSTMVSNLYSWYIKTESFVLSENGEFFGSPMNTITVDVNITNKMANRLGFVRLGAPSTPIDPKDTTTQYQYIKILSSDNLLYPIMNVSENPSASFYLVPISCITKINGNIYTITYSTRAFFQPMMLYRCLNIYTALSRAVTSVPNHDITSYYTLLNPWEYTPISSLTLYRYMGSKTFTIVSTKGLTDSIVLSSSSRYYLKIDSANLFIKLPLRSVYTALSQFDHVRTYLKSDTGEYCYVNNEYVLRSDVVTGTVYSKRTIYSVWDENIAATIKYIAVNNEYTTEDDTSGNNLRYYLDMIYEDIVTTETTNTTKNILNYYIAPITISGSSSATNKRYEFETNVILNSESPADQLAPHPETIYELTNASKANPNCVFILNAITMKDSLVFRSDGLPTLFDMCLSTDNSIKLTLIGYLKSTDEPYKINESIMNNTDIVANSIHYDGAEVKCIKIYNDTFVESANVQSKSFANINNTLHIEDIYFDFDNANMALTNNSIVTGPSSDGSVIFDITRSSKLLSKPTSYNIGSTRYDIYSPGNTGMDRNYVFVPHTSDFNSNKCKVVEYVDASLVKSLQGYQHTYYDKSKSKYVTPSNMKSESNDTLINSLEYRFNTTNDAISRITEKITYLHDKQNVLIVPTAGDMTVFEKGFFNHRTEKPVFVPSSKPVVHTILGYRNTYTNQIFRTIPDGGNGVYYKVTDKLGLESYHPPIPTSKLVYNTQVLYVNTATLIRSTTRPRVGGVVTRLKFETIGNNDEITDVIYEPALDMPIEHMDEIELEELEESVANSTYQIISESVSSTINLTQSEINELKRAAIPLVQEFIDVTDNIESFDIEYRYTTGRPAYEKNLYFNDTNELNYNVSLIISESTKSSDGTHNIYTAHGGLITMHGTLYSAIGKWSITKPTTVVLSIPISKNDTTFILTVRDNVHTFTRRMINPPIVSISNGGYVVYLFNTMNRNANSYSDVMTDRISGYPEYTHTSDRIVTISPETLTINGITYPLDYSFYYPYREPIFEFNNQCVYSKISGYIYRSTYMLKTADVVTDKLLENSSSSPDNVSNEGFCRIDVKYLQVSNHAAIINVDKYNNISQLNMDYRSTFGTSCFNISITPVSGSKLLTFDYTIDPNELYIDSTMQEKSMFGKYMFIDNKVYDIFNIADSKLSISNASNTFTDANATKTNLFKETYSVDNTNGIYVNNNNCYETLNASKHYVGGCVNGEMIYTNSSTFLDIDSTVMNTNISNNTENTPYHKHRYTRVINTSSFECTQNPQGAINAYDYQSDDYSFMIVPKLDARHNTINGSYPVVHRNANIPTNFCTEDQLYKIKDMNVKVMNTKLHIRKPVSRDMMLYDLNKQRLIIDDYKFDTFVNNVNKTIILDDVRNVTNNVLALKLSNPIGSEYYVSPANMPDTSFKLVYDPIFVVTSESSKGNVTFTSSQSSTYYYSSGREIDGREITKTGYTGIDTLLGTREFNDFDKLEAYRVRMFKCSANDELYMIVFRIGTNRYQTISDSVYNEHQLDYSLKIVPYKANGSVTYNRFVLLDRYGYQFISEVEDVELLEDGSVVSTGRFNALLDRINSEEQNRMSLEEARVNAELKMSEDKRLALIAKNNADDDADIAYEEAVEQLNDDRDIAIEDAHTTNATDINTATSVYNQSIKDINDAKTTAYANAETRLNDEIEEHADTYARIKGEDCGTCSVCKYKRSCLNGLSNCGTCEVCRYKNRVCLDPDVSGRACGNCEVCKYKRTCTNPDAYGTPCGKCTVCLYKACCVNGDGTAKSQVEEEKRNAKTVYDTTCTEELQKKTTNDTKANNDYNTAVSNAEQSRTNGLANNKSKYDTAIKQADIDKNKNDTTATDDYNTAVQIAANDMSKAIKEADDKYNDTVARASDGKDDVIEYILKFIHKTYDDLIAAGQDWWWIRDYAYNTHIKPELITVYWEYADGVPLPEISKVIYDPAPPPGAYGYVINDNKTNTIDTLSDLAESTIDTEFTKIVNKAKDTQNLEINRATAAKPAQESAALAVKNATLNRNVTICAQAKKDAAAQKEKDDASTEVLYQMNLTLALETKTETLAENADDYDLAIAEATDRYNTTMNNCDTLIANKVYEAARTRINDDELSDSNYTQSLRDADSTHSTAIDNAISTRDNSYAAADIKMNNTINAINRQTTDDINTAYNTRTRTKQQNRNTYNARITQIENEYASAIEQSNHVYDTSSDPVASELLRSINAGPSVLGLFRPHPRYNDQSPRFIINCFVKNTLVNVVDTCQINVTSCDYFKVTKIHQHYMLNKSFLTSFREDPRSYLQSYFDRYAISNYLANPTANESMMYYSAPRYDVTYISDVSYMMITDSSVSDNYTTVRTDINIRVKNMCSFNDGFNDYVICPRGRKTQINSYPNLFTNESVSFTFMKTNGYFESGGVAYDIYDLKSNTQVIPTSNTTLVLNYIHNTYHIDDLYVRKYDTFGVHDTKANGGTIDITYYQNHVSNCNINETGHPLSTSTFVNKTNASIGTSRYILNMVNSISRLPNRRSTILVDPDKFCMLQSSESIRVSYNITGSYVLLDSYDDSNRIDRVFVLNLQNQHVISYINNGNDNSSSLRNSIVAKYAELGYHTSMSNKCEYDSIIEYNKVGFFYEYNKSITASNELSHEKYHYVHIYDISKDYCIIPFKTYNVPVHDNVACNTESRTVSFYDMLDRRITASYASIISNTYICNSVMDRNGAYEIDIDSDTETLSFMIDNATYTYNLADVFMGNIQLFDNTTLKFHETATPRSSNNNLLQDRELRFIINDATSYTSYTRSPERKVYVDLTSEGRNMYDNGLLMYNRNESASSVTTYDDIYGRFVLKPIDYTIHGNTQGFSMIPNYKSIQTFWVDHVYSSKIYDITFPKYNYDICKYSCKYGRITSSDQAYDYINVLTDDNLKVQLPFYDVYVNIPKSVYIFNNFSFISCDNLYTKSYYQTVNGNYYRFVDKRSKEYFYKLDKCIMKLRFKRNNYILPFNNSSIHYKLQPAVNNFVSGDSYSDFVIDSPYTNHIGNNLKCYCNVQLRATLTQLNSGDPCVLNIAKLHITNQQYENGDSLSTRNMVKYQDMKCKQISQYREVTNYIKLKCVDDVYVDNNNVHSIIDLYAKIPSECVYDSTHKYNIRNVTVGIAEAFNELENENTYNSIVSAPTSDGINCNNIRSLMLIRDVSNDHKLTGIGFTSNANYQFTDYYVSNSIESKCSDSTAWFDKRAFKDEINADNAFLSISTNAYDRIVNGTANYELKQYASNFGYRKFDVTDREFKYVHDYDDSKFDINTVINRNDKRFTYTIGSEELVDGISNAKVSIVETVTTRSIDDEDFDVNVPYSFDTYRGVSTVSERAIDTQDIIEEEKVDTGLTALFNSTITHTINYSNNVFIKKVLYRDDESLFGLSKAHAVVSRYLHDINIFPPNLNRTFKSNVITDMGEDGISIDKSNNVSFNIAAVRNSNDIELPNIYKIKVRNFTDDVESDTFVFVYNKVEFVFWCDNVKYITDPITGALNAAPIDKNLSMNECQPVVYTRMNSLCLKSGNLQSGMLTDETMKNIKKLSDDNNAKDTMYTYTKITANHDLLYDAYYDTIRTNISAEKNNFTKVEMYGTPTVGIQFGFDCIPVTSDIKKSRTLNFLDVMQDVNFNANHDTYRLNTVMDYNKGTFKLANNSYNLNRYDETKEFVDDYYYNFTVDDDLWKRLGFNPCRINNDNVLKYTRYGDSNEPVYVVKGKYYSEEIYNGPINVPHSMLINEKKIIELSDKNSKTTITKRTIKPSDNLNDLDAELLDKYFNKKIHYGERMLNLSVPSNIDVHVTQNEDVEKVVNDADRFMDGAGLIGSYNVIRANEPVYNNIQQSIEINQTVVVPEKGDLYVYLSAPNQRYPIINSEAMLNIEYIK